MQDIAVVAKQLLHLRIVIFVQNSTLFWLLPGMIRAAALAQEGLDHLGC
jgi:hypothetical protein